MKALKLVTMTRFLLMLGICSLCTAAFAQAQNQAPVNTIPGAQNAATGTSLVFSTANGNLISISDPDAGTSKVIVFLQATNGTLTLSGTTGLTFGEGDGTADTKLTIIGTVTDINTALAGLSFTPTAPGPATLTINTFDQGNTGAGGPRSDMDTVTITVAQSNQAPVNTVPGAQNASVGTPLFFSSGTGNLISINDPDAGTSPVLVTLQVTNGTLTLSGKTGLAFTTGDGTDDTTMTFSGTMAAINTALAGLKFTPTTGGSATLTITTFDQGNTGPGGARTDIDTVTINVAALNQAPVNTVPGTQNTPVDTPLVFSTGNGNLISISDADANPNEVAVTLEVTNGTLTLSGITGLTFIPNAGDGTADSRMIFKGTVSAINAALAGLSFTPTSGFSGDAALTITTFDQGNTGAGGAQTDIDTVTITVGDTVTEPPTSDNVELTVSKTFTSTSATLVYRLKNRSNAELTNIVVQGNLGDFFGTNFTLRAGLGRATTRVLNPRTGERRVTWNNFRLRPGADAQLTLTVRLPSRSTGKVIARNWTATFATTGNGVLSRTPDTVRVP